MNFSERLKQLRLNCAFKQKELAALIGVSVRTFQDYEHGNTEPNIERLIKLADIFQVSIDYLVGREFNPLPATDAEEHRIDLPVRPNE